LAPPNSASVFRVQDARKGKTILQACLHREIGAPLLQHSANPTPAYSDYSQWKTIDRYNGRGTDGTRLYYNCLISRASFDLLIFGLLRALSASAVNRCQYSLRNPVFVFPSSVCFLPLLRVSTPCFPPTVCSLLTAHCSLFFCFLPLLLPLLRVSTPCFPPTVCSLLTAHCSLLTVFLLFAASIAVSITASIAVWQPKIHSCIKQSRD